VLRSDPTTFAERPQVSTRRRSPYQWRSDKRNGVCGNLMSKNRRVFIVSNTDAGTIAMPLPEETAIDQRSLGLRLRLERPS